MNRIVVGGAIALVVVAMGIVFAFSSISKKSDVSDMAVTNQQPEKQSAAPIGKSSPTPQAAGEYVDYNQSDFEKTDGTRLLFFHAPWCSQCQKLDKSITSQPKIADNTTIFKVDYDTQNDLRTKYGVTLQTTIVKVDKDGNKLDSFVAYQDPSYESVAEHFNLQ